MHIVKNLAITPKSHIYVTDEPAIVQEGLAPANFEEIVYFIGSVLRVETDKFIIFCKVMEEFGQRRDVMAFAWAVICGTTLIETLQEMTDIVEEGDEGEFSYSVAEGPDGNMYI